MCNIITSELLLELYNMREGWLVNRLCSALLVVGSASNYLLGCVLWAID